MSPLNHTLECDTPMVYIEGIKAGICSRIPPEKRDESCLKIRYENLYPIGTPKYNDWAKGFLLGTSKIPLAEFNVSTAIPPGDKVSHRNEIMHLVSKIPKVSK